jgi:hypothetical protein
MYKSRDKSTTPMMDRGIKNCYTGQKYGGNIPGKHGITLTKHPKGDKPFQ